jgi:hypothetical protein
MIQPGTWLGHYTTAEAAFKHIILPHELRLSPYSHMRDPAENKNLTPIISYFVKPQAEQEQQKAYFKTREMLMAKRARMRLLSLTRDVARNGDPHDSVFGCCWVRPRLWEQYADAHQGVCLVFDAKALKGALRKHPGMMQLRNVRYTWTGIAGSEAATEGSRTLDKRIFDDATREQAVLDYMKQHYRDLSFLKSDDWRTEHEFRAVLTPTDNQRAYVDYGDALQAVVLGEKFPDWQVAGAQMVCDTAGVELKRVEWENGRPYLVKPLRTPRAVQKEKKTKRRGSRV